MKSIVFSLCAVATLLVGIPAMACDGGGGATIMSGGEFAVAPWATGQQTFARRTVIRGRVNAVPANDTTPRQVVPAPQPQKAQPDVEIPTTIKWLQHGDQFFVRTVIGRRRAWLRTRFPREIVRIRYVVATLSDGERVWMPIVNDLVPTIKNSLDVNGDRVLDLAFVDTPKLKLAADKQEVVYQPGTQQAVDALSPDRIAAH